MKKIFFIIIGLIISSIVFAENMVSYRITGIDFETDGITNTEILKSQLYIDNNKIFSGEEELQEFIHQLQQQMENFRLFENISINISSPLKPAEASDTEYKDDGIRLIHLKISFTDSKHLLCLPKPSYDSNKGAELKLKLKDTNFLGLTNTLAFEFNSLWEKDPATDESSFTLGTAFSYSLPFFWGNFSNSFENDFSFNWTIGEDSPEFKYVTGLNFKLPFEKYDLCLSVKQSFIRDNDYAAFGDEMYYAETAEFSVPVTVAMLDYTTKLLYTPEIDFVYNWDKDGIAFKNNELSSPVITAGHKLSAQKINWNKNFRNGYLLEVTNSFGWDFSKSAFIPKIQIETQYFKSFGFAALSCDALVFWQNNTVTKTGSRLRGIRDDQYFADSNMHALHVPSAIVLNLDLPFSIITTSWYEWGYKLFGPYENLSTVIQKLTYIPYKLFKYLDFELQISPFIDTALTYNEITGRMFAFEDGFYAAGVEILIYPLKWKSFVIRGSIGFDIGRKYLDRFIDTSWRDNSVSAYEIYFGLGLLY